MATSLLALIDDIASVLDDVALMTKVAAKKTAGVLGDDLALNAQQVSGVNPERELPVVWAVAVGSLKNKAILVPLALVISGIAPWLIIPLLMIGGAFLCFEGVEKLVHKFLESRHQQQAEHQAQVEALADPAVDMVQFEQQKINGAIRTDFILSAEIIVISLGTLAAASLTERVLVLVSIALAMTVGVYGLVAGIVKLDDAGLHLRKQPVAWQQQLGQGILAIAPWLMKALSVIGTAAMFMVGGDILTHNVPVIAETIHHWAQALSLGQGWLAALVSTLIVMVAGVLAGSVVLALVLLVKRLWPTLPRQA